MNRKIIRSRRNMTAWIGWVTLLGFGLGGVLLIEWAQGDSLIRILEAGASPVIQILIGSGFGMLAGMVAMIIITRPFFRKERDYYYQMIRRLDLGITGIVFLSLCAGIGEELFFRAGLQPLLGIWPVAILFVALHGYLHPKNWRLSIYGLVMTGVVAGFGYLFERAGIYSAMAAHAMLDLILFSAVFRKLKR